MATSSVPDQVADAIANGMTTDEQVAMLKALFARLSVERIYEVMINWMPWSDIQHIKDRLDA